MTQAGFSVRASIAGYTPQTVGVTLTANTTTNFTLPRIPAANLTAAGSLVLTQTGPDTENAATTVINQGDACATEISGVADGPLADWRRDRDARMVAAAGLVLHPGESVTVAVGELNRDQLTAAGANGAYSMAFAFKTGGCWRVTPRERVEASVRPRGERGVKRSGCEQLRWRHSPTSWLAHGHPRTHAVGF